ncbi:hypothetical protein [Streptomyces sp. NPDC001165]
MAVALVVGVGVAVLPLYFRAPASTHAPISADTVRMSGVVSTPHRLG